MRNSFAQKFIRNIKHVNLMEAWSWILLNVSTRLYTTYIETHLYCSFLARLYVVGFLDVMVVLNVKLYTDASTRDLIRTIQVLDWTVEFLQID